MDNTGGALSKKGGTVHTGLTLFPLQVQNYHSFVSATCVQGGYM